MKDYEYYRDEMDKGVIPVIEGHEGMDENILLGRMLTWLPRKIFGLIKYLIMCLIDKRDKKE